jgi:hypothetical protein
MVLAAASNVNVARAQSADLRSIAPGATVSFSTSDGGGHSCAALELAVASLPLPSNNVANCALPRYWTIAGLTRSGDPATNMVWATSAILGTPGTVLPGASTSYVYNEFKVAERGHDGTSTRSRRRLVDAQIAVTYDYVTQLGGLSLHRHESSLGLRIEDVTQGLPVGALSLANHDSTGDQGLTDVALATFVVPVDDGTGSVTVKLREGHTYRIYFEASASNAGVGGARAQAQWTKLVVTLDDTDDD